jgi:hypothetical protein
MRRSLIITLITLITLIPVLSSAEGDRIVLKNKDQFMGKVIALKDGLIELSTPHSDVPLNVLNQDLEHLGFAADQQGGDEEELQKDPHHLSLRNGDHFPGKVVNLNETHLGFETWFAGILQVPRDMIDSVTFGVSPQRTVYQGPHNIDSWPQKPTKPWTLRDDALVSRSTGLIGRNIPLPANFIFSSTIKWETSPNLRIHLCNEKASPAGNEVGDGYMVVINSVGIQVQRADLERTEGTKYKTLITHSSSLGEIPGKQIRLELRVDRQSRTLQLYLNGQKLEHGNDPAQAPEGTALVIESLSSVESNITISNIIVQEWDTVTEPTTREPRADNDSDTVSVDDGDRFSGKITGFDPAKPGQPFIVKSPLSPDPIEIPSRNCAAMYFSRGEAENPPANGQYQLDLRPGGNLTLSGIQLGKEMLTATHPWLGEIKIDRRIMSSISKGR